MISSLKLAALCGVSQGTVDRAVHNRVGVSEKTKKHILDQAAIYGYIPNPAAHELLTGKTEMVVALIPSFQSPFFMDMMDAIKKRLENDGLRLVISIVNDTKELIYLLKDFAARRYRAAIIIPSAEGVAIPKQVEKMNIISLLTPCCGGRSCFISPDETRVGEIATKYLIAKGHKNIVHLTYTRQTPAIIQRAKGYEGYMNNNNLSAIVECDIKEDRILSLVKKNGTTAFFCHNDWMALSIIRMLEKSGLVVPNDVSVIGVDNSPSFTALYQEITTVAYPIEWLAGEVAAAVQNTQYAINVFNDFEVVERKSVRELA